MRPHRVAAQRGLRPSYIWARGDGVEQSCQRQTGTGATDKDGGRTAVMMSGKMPAKKLRLKDCAASAEDA
jgi:hypothetical protein